MVKYYNQNNGSEVYSEFLKLANEKESLYGVTTGDDETGQDLIEQAHPEDAKTIDSYIDRGGIVENQWQQQEADIFVARRMPNGTISRKKNATNDLTNELNMIISEMEIRRQNDLVKFAKRIKKKAVGPLAVGPLAVGPLAIAGIAAAVIIPVVGAWWYMSHRTDPKNTGIDKAINELLKNIAIYKQVLLEKLTGEQRGNIIQNIDQFIVFISGLSESRNTYMQSSSSLANMLQAETNISPDKEPTAEDINNNLKKDNDDKPILDANQNQQLNDKAKHIIDYINRFNEMYKKYITTSINPRLQKELNDYYMPYFEQTKDIEGINQDWTDKVSDIVNPTLKSTGENFIQNLQSLIKSLDSDLAVREIDRKKAIDNVTSKVQSNISSQFTIDPALLAENEQPTPNTKPNTAPNAAPNAAATPNTAPIK